MKGKKVVFTEPWQVGTQAYEIDETNIPAGGALIRKMYSLISTGTEMACLSGKEGWFKMPGTPGYCCVGEIMRTGEGVENFCTGDIVYYYGNHSEYEITKAAGIFKKVPEGLDVKCASLVRMGTVAMTALRVSQIALGDYVAVVGQGLVGNFAAQLSRLQGGRVIGIDVSPMRLEASKACGLEYAVNPAECDAVAEVKNITGGKGVSTVIEAIGSPQAICGAYNYLAKGGEIILLGTPRGEYQVDVTEVLAKSHWASHDVKVKGAHEWIFPINKDPFVKFSIEGNTEIVMDYIMADKIKVKNLITDTIKPDDAAEYYAKLRANRDSCLGVQFDWN